MSADAPVPPPVPAGAELTVDELAAAAGIPVRRIRFYAGKKLLPPPRLDGRTGLYGESHLARLRLIAELQDAGYTLAAIEEFLSTVPADADAEAVALVGTLAAPTSTGPALVLSRADLAAHLDRVVDDALLDDLADAALLTVAGEDELHMTQSQLEFALRILDTGAPLDALIEASVLVRRHARALAEDLQAVFQQRIIGALGDDGTAEEDRTRVREVARALRPLTIQAIVSAYQDSLDEIVHEARGTTDA